MAQPTENIPMKDASLVDEFGICQSETPVVSICCITYNHEKFIRDALDGFLIQKTDFPIEIIVRDDASADATATIVRQYQTKHPNLIRAIYHTQNQYALGKRAFPEVFAMARGKYIALCEGDDYWTDPLKLQKQVDFLEAHPECSLCFHKVLRVNEDDIGNEQEHDFPNLDCDHIFTREQFFGTSNIQTCSVLFRNLEIDQLDRFIRNFQVGDTPLFYFYAERGNLAYLNEKMAIYRVHLGGIWTRRSKVEKLFGVYETNLKLRQLLHIKKSPQMNRVILDYLLRIVDYYREIHDYKTMRKYLIDCFPFLSQANDKQQYMLKRRAFEAFFPKLYIRLQ